MAALLKEYVNRRTCFVIYNLLRSALLNSERTPKGLERVARDPDSLWRMDAYVLAKAIRQRVKQFCIQVGCPHPASIIFNVNSLREMALSKMSKPEASLQKTMDALLKQNQQPQKEVDKLKLTRDSIITCLAYRHALEQLCSDMTYVPGASNPKRPSRTHQWQAFWKKATGNAETDAGHSFAALKRDPLLPWSQIRDAGNDLFARLSANIHHFVQDEFVVNPSQWINAAWKARYWMP